MKKKEKVIQIKYSTDNPNKKYWIRVTDSNRLRDIALKKQKKEIRKAIDDMTSINDTSIYGQVRSNFAKELKQKLGLK